MGALVVERTGAGVVVRAEDARAPMAPPFTLADGRTQVYVDETALSVFDQLEPEVLARLRAELRPEGVGLPAIRLLSPRAGLAAPNGSRPLALRLSEALDVEVLAPDGELVMLPGGELFSAGEQTGWVGFRPGSSKLHDGPRYPVPEWQDGLSASLRTRPIDPRISITPIPAGVWVRAAGQPPRPHGDIGFRVPLSRNRLAIVVGAPGEPLPAAEALAAFVGGLPTPLRETFGLIGYGPEPVSVRPIAQQLAELIGQAVHGCHAVPQYLPEGGQTWLVHDASGEPTWLPFVLESTYQPGAPPIPRNWLPPVSGLTGAGAGTFWLQDGWLVDVLAAGLLVRPVRVPVDPVASRLPISPDAVNLVVSSAGGPPPERVLLAVERLANDLPAAARERLRLIATPHTGPDHLGRLAASLQVDVHVLGTAGPGPAISVTPNAPLRSHPWESGAGALPAGVTGHPVAWVPAPPSGVSSAPRRADPTAAQVTSQLPMASALPVSPDPGVPAVEPEAAHSAESPQPLRHQSTEPLRIVFPVTVDAEGRMRPVGDGWRPGEPGAAAPAVPAVPEVAAADVTAGPPAPTSLGPATPLPKLSQPQSAELPVVAPTPVAERVEPVALPHVASAAEAGVPAASQNPATPEKPHQETKPASPSPVAVPVTATSVQIPVVASSTPLPPMKPEEPEPVSEPAEEDAAPEHPEPTPPKLTSPKPAPPAPVASAAGPPPAPVAPLASIAPAGTPAALPVTPPVAPAAQPAAHGPAPVAPAAAANRTSSPAPAVTAPVAPPVHAPAPLPAAVTAVATEPKAPEVPHVVPSTTGASGADAVKTGSSQGETAPAAESQPAVAQTTAVNLAELDVAVEQVVSTEADSFQQDTAAMEDAAATETSDAAGVEVGADEQADTEQAESDDQVAAAVLKPLLLMDHSSTEADRQQFKKSLGWKYDAATRSVTRLLAERPGLRGGMPVDDAMLTELAAVHVFATSDQRELVDAIRTGNAAAHYPFISCLAGGLRRLPSLQGMVVRGGPGEAETVADYVVGSELVEPAPMLGVSDESAEVPGAVELLIWSVTARRLGGLAADENSADVVFPPATSYRVLAVEADAGRVLLTEVGKKQRSEEARQKHDARVLERLTEAAKSRDERTAAETTAPDHERYSVLLGEPANPFAEAAGIER
ncbi:hypothetical protein [Saccharopolyspora mangrovi]|uniref:Uncharacterized protein n=1 Tax=Saccharopolyspora mangrovi TaxID=3082379 RepID=A0ABU6A7Z4_9PSEU|nr:hypothetical protein [Saccharopolyspora sp. S2-29]MEB3367692.1 hypothetical protein [Saccharopolyspora sp. S2-29]